MEKADRYHAHKTNVQRYTKHYRVAKQWERSPRDTKYWSIHPLDHSVWLHEFKGNLAKKTRFPHPLLCCPHSSDGDLLQGGAEKVQKIANLKESCGSPGRPFMRRPNIFINFFHPVPNPANQVCNFPILLFHVVSRLEKHTKKRNREKDMALQNEKKNLLVTSSCSSHKKFQIFSFFFICHPEM